MKNTKQRFAVDGVMHETCEECDGRGHTRCPTCGQEDGDCPKCHGAGMVPCTEEAAQ